ncbi:50S ribosomal protein L5 [Phycisphaerales bacterium AB-hyl4]|uniref:Large ribosomal subunit protein uL5 n=1 Tax=Natronomicrosphaera hydrolytica TaxID=3242702 RepID=A0ABV4U609_9BACT
MTPRLKEKFAGPVSEKLKQEFSVTNPMAMPRLEKIVLSVGLGKQLEGTKVNAKAREQVLQDLALITGQKAVMVKAKKSVSNFKVRSGYETGAMVTVRGTRMWELLDRLITLAIPRIKDFRGLSDKSFDGRGSYSFGVQEQGIFPEIDMANAQFMHGMHITLVFKNSDNDKTRFVLKELGWPFVGKDTEQAAA